MLRFEAKKGFYLYPESSGIEPLELRLNSGSTYENNVIARDDISVIKCGLRIPKTAENYVHFKTQMRDSEMVFINQFNS
jgi:hypothetical protein